MLKRVTLRDVRIKRAITRIVSHGLAAGVFIISGYLGLYAITHHDIVPAIIGALLIASITGLEALLVDPYIGHLLVTEKELSNNSDTDDQFALSVTEKFVVARRRNILDNLTDDDSVFAKSIYRLIIDGTRVKVEERLFQFDGSVLRVDNRLCIAKNLYEWLKLRHSLSFA